MEWNRWNTLALLIVTLINFCFLGYIYKGFTMETIYMQEDVPKPASAKTLTGNMYPDEQTRLNGCLDVQSSMVNGFWEQLDHAVVPLEFNITEMYEYARLHQTSLSPFYRADGVCGSGNTRGKFFRELCDRLGPRPCCYNDQCISAAVNQCRCEGCLDERPKVVAEYSRWVPKDKNCSPYEYTKNEACHLLKDDNLLFIGDSMIRNFYLAVGMMLTGDFHSGMRNQIKSCPKECFGERLFVGKLCRVCVNRSGPRMVCNTSSISFMKKYKLGTLPMQTIKKSMMSLGVGETYIILGVGMHYQFSFPLVYKDVMKIINDLQLAAGPSKQQLIWVTTQRADTTMRKQSDAGKIAFNKKMIALMKSQRIPVIDISNITTNVLGFDGVHFGIGVNMLKAQLLFNSITYWKRQSDRATDMSTIG